MQSVSGRLTEIKDGALSLIQRHLVSAPIAWLNSTFTRYLFTIWIFSCFFFSFFSFLLFFTLLSTLYIQKEMKRLVVVWRHEPDTPYFSLFLFFTWSFTWMRIPFLFIYLFILFVSLLWPPLCTFLLLLFISKSIDDKTQKCLPYVAKDQPVTASIENDMTKTVIMTRELIREGERERERRYVFFLHNDDERECGRLGCWGFCYETRNNKNNNPHVDR